RRKRTVSVLPVQISAASTNQSSQYRSVELGGEGLAVVSGARVVGAEDLEEIDELLAGALVVLDPVEEAVELALDLTVGVGRRGFVAQAGDGRDAAGLGRLRDP